MHKIIQSIAGISMFALLSGCANPSANFFANNPFAAGTDVATFEVQGQEIALSAIPGYCIEKKLTQAGDVGYLVVMGGCSRIADGAKGIRLAKNPVIISSHLSIDKSAVSQASFTRAAIEFGQSTAGSRDFKIFDRDVSNSVVYLDAEYVEGSPLQGTESRVVIGMQSIGGYTVTHTAFRVTGSGVSQKDAAKIIKALATKTAAVN